MELETDEIISAELLELRLLEFESVSEVYSPESTPESIGREEIFFFSDVWEPDFLWTTKSFSPLSMRLKWNIENIFYRVKK